MKSSWSTPTIWTAWRLTLSSGQGVSTLDSTSTRWEDILKQSVTCFNHYHWNEPFSLNQTHNHSIPCLYTVKGQCTRLWLLEYEGNSLYICTCRPFSQSKCIHASILMRCKWESQHQNSRLRALAPPTGGSRGALLQFFDKLGQCFMCLAVT